MRQSANRQLRLRQQTKRRGIQRRKDFFWFPDIRSLQEDIDEYALETKGVTSESIYQTCLKSDFDKYYKAQSEFLANNKPSDYVDNVITITLHFANGSTENKTIAVSITSTGNFTVTEYKADSEL